jgi:hypothetical protein
MELLKLKRKVEEYYRNNVKGNKNISYDQIRRKMTRNMLLAKKEDSTGYPCQMYKYGSLWFLVKDGKVVWMKNKCKVPEDWVLDKDKYNKLNKELGIEEDEKIEVVNE